ncbi:MAG: hypothetical protein D6816_08625, partial [Bacteroidetes bacterium]
MKTTLHPFASEKRLNEIILDDMAGVPADSLALADLRIITPTCLSEGGRAVLSARALCEILLKEHYDDGGCSNSPEGRSAS